MAEQKRIWFSFLPLDYRGVEAYLNRYAAKGWALVKLEDCRTLTVLLERTKRTDLCYSVSCTSLVNQKELHETVEQRQTLGWKPLATVNHFDLYESMPCRHVFPREDKQVSPLILRSLRSFLWVLLFSGLLILLSYSRNGTFMDEWYLTNVGVCLHFLLPIFGVAAIGYLLWLVFRLVTKRNTTIPKQSLLFLRGILPLLTVGWLFCLTAAVLADLIPSLAYCLLLISTLMGAGVFCYVRFRTQSSVTLFSAISMTIAIILALALALNLLLPSQNRAEMGRCSWRHTLSSVIHAEDFGFQTSSLEVASYETQGSVLVEKTNYWEGWTNLNWNSTVYQCRSELLVSTVMAEQMKKANWQAVSSPYKGCWTAERGDDHLLLCYDGTTIVYVSADQTFPSDLTNVTLPF